ncbi:MAG: hypothetical protein R3A45_12535 [Bdellovibrionota bacterium]
MKKIYFLLLTAGFISQAASTLYASECNGITYDVTSFQIKSDTSFLVSACVEKDAVAIEIAVDALQNLKYRVSNLADVRSPLLTGFMGEILKIDTQAGKHVAKALGTSQNGHEEHEAIEQKLQDLAHVQAILTNEYLTRLGVEDRVHVTDLPLYIQNCK